jgi:HEAT repeat protein
MPVDLFHIAIGEPVMAKALIPYQYLMDVSVLLFSAVLSLLVFIIFYLLYYLNRAAKRKYLVAIYSDVISEIILCDTQTELEETIAQPYIQKVRSKWFSKPFGRRILIQELVKIHKTISGKGAENIRWFFEHIELQNDCLRNFESKKWNRKASAIQQLAEMKQEKFLAKIYRATNSKNRYIRTEAQIAIVKLTGFKGLRFLNVITHPLTQWQQLCLLRELSFEASYDAEKIKQWLQSKNKTVVEFSLRLIKNYVCFELYNEVANCIQHSSGTVRLQAIHTLLEIATEETPDLLKENFDKMEENEKLCILTALGNIGGDEHAPFFSSLQYENAAVKNAATVILKKHRTTTANVYLLQNDVERKADVA